MTGRLRGLRGLRSLRGQPQHGRRGGEKISYSPEATDRYKSPFERLTKAQAILAGWNTLVTEEDVSATVTLYRISSDRSPFGYWTVAASRDPGDPTLPPPYLPDVPPDEIPGGGDPLPSVYAVYTDGLGFSSPGLPPGLEITIGSISVGGLTFPYPTGEIYPGGVVVVAPGSATIVSPDDVTGLTLNQTKAAAETVWFRHSKLYELAGEPFIVWLIRRWSGPGPNPPIYDDLNSFGYDNPPDYDTPLIDFGGGTPTPIGPGEPIGGGSSDGPGGGDPLEQDPTPPPRYPPIPNEPSNPPEGFSCDCPDWTRFEYLDAESPYPSRWRDREWIDSNAGSEGDCKHIMAVKLRLGLPVP